MNQTFIPWRVATVLLLALQLLASITALAGGSIDFASVQKELEAEAPKLIQAACASFDINEVGGALRLGPHSAEAQIEGDAVVGKRVPPYEFMCRLKGSKGDYDLLIVFDRGDSGWAFTVRDRTPVTKPTR